MNRSAARQCRGKVRHHSDAAGRKALAGTIAETGDVALVAYPCTHCGGFHVGHPPRNVQRAIRVNHLIELIERAVKS